MQNPKKSLGQNFLIDKNIISKIINTIQIKNRNIIEIGPGTGSLTEEIFRKKPKSLILIEKDNNLTEKLKLKYSTEKNLKIYKSDVLKFDFEKLKLDKTIVFGNLPYNISSQILVKILRFKKWPPNFSDLIFMFQKELGEKIIAKFPSSNYGRLSILTNLRLKIMNKFLVSRNCFFPKPKITSIVMHFKTYKNKNFYIKNMSNLEKITNILFSNKRKMINKSIRKILNEYDLKKLPELKLNLRAENIEPNIFYKITEIYEANKDQH